MSTVTLKHILQHESDCETNLGRAARGLVRRAILARTQADESVAVASDLDGSPLVVAQSGLADMEQTRELFYAAESGRPENPTPSYTVRLKGNFMPMIEEPSLGRYIARFCNRHARQPETLQDDHQELYRFAIKSAAVRVPSGADKTLTANDYLLTVIDAPDHTEWEWDNLAHQNYQHLDINEQLATQILEQPAGRWVLTGLDPEGMDFRCGSDYCRLPFPDATMTYPGMGKAIKVYLKEARARLGIFDEIK